MSPFYSFNLIKQNFSFHFSAFLGKIPAILAFWFRIQITEKVVQSSILFSAFRVTMLTLADSESEEVLPLELCQTMT